MKIVRVFTTLGVLAAGVAGFTALKNSRQVAHKVPPAQRGVLVEVMEARPAPQAIEVIAQGTVMAAQEVSLVPQVSGVVLDQHPGLVPGGFLKLDDVVVRIDDTDATLAVAQRRAALLQAEQALELEQGRKAVALREWKLMGEKAARAAGVENSAARATREPQVKSAEAAVAAARSALRQASVARERATIKAPFNALVLSEAVDVGQLVGPGTPIARLVGTDRFWVEALVPMRDLPLIQLPEGETPGAEATVVVQVGEGTVERAGRVVRRLGELDPQSRMARVIIEVADPLGLASDVEPLLLRSYVQVRIQGPTLESLFALPRSAVREGDLVWVVDAENRLVIREVEEARRLGDQILVRKGLAAGDKVVTSRVASPVEGMALRIKGAEAVAQAPASAAEARP